MLSTWAVLMLAGGLELDPALPCGLSSELPLTLPPGWTLRATREGEAIELRLSDGAVLVASRRLSPRPEDCPALPRIVATLVRSWLDNPFPAPAAQPKKKAPAPAVVQAEAPPDEVEPAPGAEPPPEPAPLPAPELSDAPPRPPPRASPPMFSVMAAGGVALPGDTVPTGTVTLTGDWTISGRWGLSLAGGLQSDRVAGNFGIPRISASLHWFGVAGRFEVTAFGGHQLFVAAGLQLVHLWVRGWSATFAQADLFLPALGVQVESHHALTQSLFLVARLGLNARLRPELIRLDTATLSVDPFDFGLQLGLGWNFP